MIYLISGASRAGKSILAKRLSGSTGFSFFSLDFLTMAFTNGLPEYGIHDKLMPAEIAEKSWSFIRSMIESIIHIEEDYIIEGEALLPELVTELDRKYPGKLRICFLGFTRIDPLEKAKEVRSHSNREKDWLHDQSDQYLLDHVKNMISHSRLIEKSCKENQLKYIDTSPDFLERLEEAFDFLRK